MYTKIPAPKKFSNEELKSLIIFMNQFGGLSDEQLRQRDLKIGEPQKINHFLVAANLREVTITPAQAVTLLRLTPILLPKGSQAVHSAIIAATPIVRESYAAATDLEEKRRLAGVLKQAGLVCMNKRLGPTSIDNRLREFEMFKDFVGETPEYRAAKARFEYRHRPHLTSLRDVAREAPVAAQALTGQMAYGLRSKEWT